MMIKKPLFLLLMTITILSFSHVVSAITLGQKLLNDAQNESEKVKTVIQDIYRAWINVPAKALSNENYLKVLDEYRKIAPSFETLDRDKMIDKEQRDYSIQHSTLRTRITYLIDHKSLGNCSKFPFDQESAKNSDGDWSKVKMKNGDAIDPGGSKHLTLFKYYLYGCNGKQDFRSARKVLFSYSDIQSLKSPENVNAEMSHCQAEVWARYGIGGEVDVVQADEFSRRFTNTAWFPNSEDTPEKRKELSGRPEYQHGVRDDFKCPDGNQRYRVDPRSPWKNIW